MESNHKINKMPLPDLDDCDLENLILFCQKNKRNLRFFYFPTMTQYDIEDAKVKRKYRPDYKLSNVVRINKNGEIVP